ncbi:hypothetical protein [Maribacter polysaccharolyticus]|uniref:hypothetical protein n=1 Tax=Maribacter polysaccharolyticus TaxID=3020831 RepID=UPI00237F414F|nr:hypothetical protein [Maribacter polysaccharolyticus]MDE3741476.1 hypothetical protein [Maribacter polysaccharolyticus]
MGRSPIHVLRQIKNALKVLLILGVVCEILFFPTLPNLYGCMMALIAYWVFSFFLKEKYLRIFPFAFFLYLSMFMYRYLPLIATLAEGKPITFGFERPYETFLYETILFLLSSLAFYLACQKSIRNPKNNLIQKSLFRLRFFETTPAILWGMGMLGLLVRIHNFSATVEYGDVGGKFLSGLNYLMYAPLCLIFPSLLQMKYTNKKSVWIYTVCIFILNIASNSRQSIITPIGVLAILFLLYLISNNLRVTDYLSRTKIVLLGLSLFFLLNLLSNISLAMLHTRKIKADISKMELFQKTIATVGDETLMSQLKAAKDKEEGNQFISYQQGWTEQYIDNFMLARYANMRITDQTLYYAEKKGYANAQMRNEFVGRIIALFPTPILRFFGIFFDKGSIEYSRGDLLYGSGFGGYRITSHVGDGLATFGLWYFPIQFLAFFGVFKLLNCFVYYGRKGIRYAPFALMGVFGFLGMFRNAQGMIADIGYILRGFLQGVATYVIIFYCVRFALSIINPKYIRNQKLKNVYSI